MKKLIWIAPALLALALLCRGCTCSPSDPAADEDGDGLINGQDCAPCDATRGPSEDCA